MKETQQRVVFHKIRWKNFMGTGAYFTEFELDSSNKNLLIGKNGSGKSQIIEAIVFALYNKSFRPDVNKPDLINTFNNKDCVVELELSVMGSQYKVMRSQRPNEFNIWKDGILQDKTNSVDLQSYLENSVIKMNYKTFIQVVILGDANFVPFMQLPAAQRREVNENLLELQTFSLMNVLLKGKISLLKQEMTALNTEVLKNEQAVLIYTDQLKKTDQDKDDLLLKLNEDLGEVEGELVACQMEIDKRRHNLETMTIDDISHLEKKRGEMMTIKGKMQAKRSSAQDTISFFTSNDHCPTCEQDITEAHKVVMVESNQAIVESMDDGMSKIMDMLVVNDNTIRDAKKFVDQFNKLSSEIKVFENQIKNLNRRKLQLENDMRRAEITVGSADIKEKLQAEEAKLYETKKEIFKTQSRLDHYEVAAGLLKDDGIKASIMAKYLPVINQQVNAYLGIMNFFVGFEMNETFEVTFKNQYRDKFKYGMFSQGQKARIDLALMMTWRDIAKLKNSVSTNLLIMDEVFDGSLDTDGSEELLQILNALTNENVWVISHKDLYVEKFDRVYKFVLERNFSQMEILK